MKKTCCLFLMTAVLLLSGLLNVSAQEYAVEDLAEVLNPELVNQISTLNIQLKEELDIEVKVITRHFLGGKNVQAYANQTLESLNDDGLVLLVIVVGEERYAAAIGSKARELLSSEKAEALLNEYFREPYLKERAYSRALASFLLETGNYLQARTGKHLLPNNLLQEFAGRTAVSQPSAPVASDESVSWLDSIFEDVKRSVENAVQYDNDAREAVEGQGKGISLFQIVLIGFILYKIFGKKRNGRNGCGPLGWIFGTWGLSKFFGWRK
jgi:uncharacterized membrane protein YgcG